MIKIMFLVGNHQLTIQTNTSMLFDIGLTTNFTIQIRISTFWGTLCKIWLFLWKKIGLKLPPFCEGPFLCSSITRKIYPLEPWNLVENCPIHSYVRYISHCLTTISNVVFIIFNVREGYPYPPNPEFLAWKATRLHIYDFISYVCNA